MSIGRLSIFLALAMAAACAKAQDDKPPAPGAAPADADTDALGVLRFEFSGGTAHARSLFVRGLLALHSFWYEEASRRFKEAIEADPTFSMGYWGLAMSKAKLMWGDDDLAAGREALLRMPAKDRLPPRDQAWVMAARSLFAQPKMDVRTSRKSFLAVMEQLHAQFPDDESALFLALALLSTVRPSDPDEVAVRQRAGALAMEVFNRNPKHPGAAHYAIHAYDTTALASRAVPAAQVYAGIAPAAFHALHMPAHIFTRLARWKEAVASCQAAWDASVAWVAREKLAPDQHDFHSLSWLIELNFERGRRTEAERVMSMYADAVRGGLTHEKRAAYANQVTSFLARTGEWARVEELLAPLKAAAVDAPAGGRTSSSACGQPPQPSGPPMQQFERRAVLGARARAAAMRHDQALLGRTLDEREAVDAEIRPFLVASQSKEFIERVDLLGPLGRTALMAHAVGDDRALVAALRPLAVDQDQEVTTEGAASGILYREELAEALLRLGQPKLARVEYGLVLAKYPGRARALLGTARAAAKAADAVASRDAYRSLLSTWSEADDTTDGLVEARQAVADARR